MTYFKKSLFIACLPLLGLEFVLLLGCQSTSTEQKKMIAAEYAITNVSVLR